MSQELDDLVLELNKRVNPDSYEAKYITEIATVALEFRVPQAALDFALDLLAIGDRESGWGYFLKPKDATGSGDWTARLGHWLGKSGTKTVDIVPVGWHRPTKKDINGNTVPCPGPYCIPNDELGFGRGLMQVDYFDPFIQEKEDDGTPSWQVVLKIIRRGASIYNTNLTYFHGDKKKAFGAYNCGVRKCRTRFRCRPRFGPFYYWPELWPEIV